MIHVPIHPDLCPIMPVATLCRSLLLQSTLQCLPLLRNTCAALNLSVLLLKYLRSGLICDTNICPHNTEESSILKPQMNKSKAGITYNSYLRTPLPTISYTSITAPKNWYRLIKIARETTSTEKCTSVSSSKSLRAWLEIQ